MKNKIGFIAVGQAGGNIGQQFEKRGYPVLYINTSQEDLDTLKNSKYVYHITNGDGANKNRDKAKQLVIEDYDNIAAMIDKVVDSDILFVLFSSGGGTGSGSGPMLIDMLTGEGRQVGAVTILPQAEESVKTQFNAYECFKELINLDKMASLFILDNSREDKFKINENFVELFCSYITIPQNYISDKGNIDDAEIKETLLTIGVSCIVGTEKTDIAQLIQSIKNNIYAPIEATSVKYIALAADESLGSIELNELHKAVNVPLDEYRAYTDGNCIIFLAGLPYPVERLDSIHSLIVHNKDIVIANSKRDKTELKNDLDFWETATKPRAEPKSKRDIMAKYLKK